jgi:hypothetical protein
MKKSKLAELALKADPSSIDTLAIIAKTSPDDSVRVEAARLGSPARLVRARSSPRIMSRKLRKKKSTGATPRSVRA